MSIDLFYDKCNGTLVEVPAWVKKGISHRAKSGRVILVSAVCPDYERINSRFTYRGVGSEIPYIAGVHLEIVKEIAGTLEDSGVELVYYITLADTEFDLPLVVDHMTNGSADEFLRRCQASCDKLFIAAEKLGLPIAEAGRFTKVFGDWFDKYQDALNFLRQQLEEDSGLRCNLAEESSARVPLYQAMIGRAADMGYCCEMVLRQWAQYMAWGECATEKFGTDLVMMNHSTSNLRKINHPHFRQGRERIPILQLSAGTMPE
ncbi:hypothetical protein COT99_04180 [Candidatus Falkowbacteria bacterium CG10_big_fil_rev_8_21_14_0_10_43_10]|uniref:Uncharacterized protein n=1 Tax=Candidatus Falkowbacteria bacterium CG10_big_fil_rev_8_21_14_0_10_43_10 TaxID=1974567 RepID=A0A2H0V168_9BACT|nr:MAG: hypothetical protein COT99_04180 [Candidatus Falkowbacteria bacterium CG10_big_fil_rev_8_21_14_0_10_43_10]